MNQISKSFWGFGNFIFMLLMKLVPSHTKRAMFIASYVAQSYHSKYGEKTTIDAETLSKLNKVMKLCGEDNLGVMRVPDAVAKVIMKGVKVYDVQQPVAETEAKAQANTIVNQIPEWWKFNSLEKDAETLFKMMPVVAQ